MTIKVYIKSVYGKPLHYVADSEQARALFILTGTKTLEHRHLLALDVLGHKVETAPAPIGWTPSR